MYVQVENELISNEIIKTLSKASAFCVLTINFISILRRRGRSQISSRFAFAQKVLRRTHSVIQASDVLETSVAASAASVDAAALASATPSVFKLCQC